MNGLCTFLSLATFLGSEDIQLKQLLADRRTFSVVYAIFFCIHSGK